MRRQSLDHPRVEDQLDEARRWYDLKHPGLSTESIASVDRTIHSLATEALLHRVRNIRRGIRWALTERFPYRSIYAVSGDMVLEHFQRGQTPSGDTS